MHFTEVIDKLNKIDVDNCTEDQIRGLFREYGKAGFLRANYFPPASEENLPNLLIRATVYNSKEETINSVSRIQYPPDSKNTKYQRASTPDRAMFYGTLHKDYESESGIEAMKICFQETFKNYDQLLESADSVVFSLWNVEKPLRLYAVFSEEDFLKNDSAMEEINEAYNELLNSDNEEIKQKTQLLLNYIVGRFSIPVDQNENDYKPSALISQLIIDTLDLSGIEIDGLIFKSTKSKNQDFNVAVRPTSCDKKLRCIKAIDCSLQPDKKVICKARYRINKANNMFELEPTLDNFVLQLD